MAAFDDTSARLRAALFHSRNWWMDEYRGTKAELIAAGFAAEGMFPGDPGVGKISVTHKGPPKINIRRRNKRVFELIVVADDDECERRNMAEKEKRATERALEEERKSIECMADSAEDFRQRTIRYLRGTIHPGRALFENIGAGYHFAPAAWEAFEDALAEAIDELEAAPIVFRASERRAMIAAVKHRTAQADPGYQAMLGHIIDTTAAQEVEDECGNEPL